MACNAEQQFAVRFNLQKMGPLGIADDDYRPVAMAVDSTEADVRELCEGFHRQNRRVAEELGIHGGLTDRPVRICFIGDSITSERTSYMNILRDGLVEDRNIEILDFAISGWQTSNVIFEFEGQVPAFRPDVVHMMIGTNDARNARPGTDGSTASLAGYRRNIEQILTLLADTGAQVVISTVPPTQVSAPLENGVVPVWEWRAFNEILRDVAAKHGILLHDMEQTLVAELDKIIDVFDHVHLNAYGQRLMAQGVYAALKKLLADKER